MARTNEQFTQAEINAFQTFCDEHAIVTDGPIGEQNGNLIGEYIAITWDQDITPATLAVALEKLRDQIAFKSAALVEVENVVSRLNQSERAIVHSWFQRQSRLEMDGDAGYKNVAEVVGWLVARRYPITEGGLQTALTNVQANRGTITWKPAPAQKSQGRPGHTDDGSGFLREDKSRKYIGGRKNHSQDPKPEGASTPAPEQDAWQILCERLLLHGTHSCQENMRRVYDSRGSKSYRQLYVEMEAVRRGYERLISYTH